MCSKKEGSLHDVYRNLVKPATEHDQGECGQLIPVMGKRRANTIITSGTDRYLVSWYLMVRSFLVFNKARKGHLNVGLART